MFSVGVLRGQEAAPIVAEDRMFVVTPYPNILYALDLTKPGAPLKWKHDPKPLAAAQGVACCDTVNRGATYADRRVFFNTLDGQQSAGRRNRRGAVADPTRRHQHRRDDDDGALVVRDKVVVGNSGGEMGVRGWIAPLMSDGGLLWRAYSTGPDHEVLIGERASRSTTGTAARIWGSRAGRLTPGGSAAARCGAG